MADDELIPPTGTPQVQPDTILSDSGVGGTVDSNEAVRNLQPLIATQQAGMWLAKAVGLLIVLILAFVIVVWFETAPVRPTMPALPNLAAAGTDQAKATQMLNNYQALNREALDNYKAMNAEALSRISGLFDLLATKALIPIFTTILGFIFGTRVAAANRDSQ